MRFVIPAVVLMVVLLGAGAWGYAQAVEPKPKAPVFGSGQGMMPVAPLTLSGDEIGFRVTSRQGDKVVGTLVVRVDGQWVPVEFATGTRPAIAK